MKKVSFIKFCLFIVISFFSSLIYANNPIIPVAIDGNLDLSQWNFQQDGSVKLNGQWHLYWQDLREPKDFIIAETTVETEYLDIPGAWNNKVINGEKIGRTGYATLRLKVRLPTSSEAMGIRVQTIVSAYKMWVNGHLISSRGQVGSSAETNNPEIQHDVIRLDGKPQTIDIVLQVSNFHRHKAGILIPLKIGTYENIKQTFFADQALELIVFGGLLFFALYFIARFIIGRLLLNRSEQGVLWFSFASLFWAGHASVWGVGGDVLSRILPWIDPQHAFALVFIFFFLAVPAVTAFISVLFPQESSKLFYKVCLAQGVFFVIAILIGNNFAYTHFSQYHGMLALIQIGYIFWVLIRALQKGREGALPALMGFSVLGIASVNDILLSNGLIDTVFLTPFGLIVMVFSQAYTLSLNAARNQLDVELLSGELEDKNRALEKTDQLKDEFLANTSHELRTPLNGIIGLAESLQNKQENCTSEKLQQNLSLIATSGRRLSNLVNDVLDLSKLKNHDIQLNQQPVDLFSLSHTVLLLSQPLIHKKPIKTINELTEQLPLVFADENRLQQILFNLIGNAIKFTHQGTIQILASVNDQWLTVSIKDTGVGIAKEQQEAIFQPYTQATDNAGGIGLGLGISRQLVELHGGSLAVESRKGEGSCFSFNIPVFDAGIEVEIISDQKDNHDITHPNLPVAMDSLSLPLSDSEGTGKRILVVDDDVVNLHVANNHLVAEGYSVTIANDGLEALELIENQSHFDLVLLDVMMPGISGLEVCRRIRHSFSSVQLPVIMVTAKNRLTDLVEGLSLGANDYLTKPYAREELLARTHAQLSVRAAYLAIKENRLLKSEIEKRKETENDLLQRQIHLTGVLNSLENALLVINLSDEIVLCNDLCAQILANDAEGLLGQPLRKYFDKEAIKGFDVMLTEKTPSLISSISIKNAAQMTLNVSVQPSLIEINDEKLLLLFIYPDSKDPNEKPEPINPSLLEDVLSTDVQTNEMQQDKRLLIVEMMNLTQDLWVQETSTTKVELAYQSGIWRVYVDKDGWERTQTLDRYFSLDRLPKYPRWHHVLRTAKFVLKQCPGESENHLKLQQAILKLEKIDE